MPPDPDPWPRCRDEDEDGPAIAAGTGIAFNAQNDADGAHNDADGEPRRAVAVAPPPPSGDWGPWNGPRPGVLDADRVEQLRRLRALGRPLRELAYRFGVSVSTVKRALRPGYRPRA